MKYNRTIRQLLAIASLSMLPMLANAHPLSIVNHTDSALSFTVNDQCSEVIGTINEVSVKKLSEKVLNKLCDNFAKPCAITAHFKSCAGASVGGIKYNSEHNFEVSGAPNTDISITATEETLIFTSPIQHG